MTDNTQPEALLPSRETLMAQAQVFASAWAIAGSRFDSGDGMEVAEQEKAILADMTRRLHARIAELEAQLESIGAGGVSGPLMGKPQEMPDLSALTERGAKAWAGVDAQGLRDGVAPVAASAGSESVAWQAEHQSGEWVNRDTPTIPSTGIYTGRIRPLYLHPSPPEGMVGRWMPIETAPEGQMVVVGWLDPEDPEHPERHDFDLLEDGCWQQWHEHAEHVEIIGGHGVSYTPPYTVWMPVGPIPTTSAGSKGE